MNDETDLPDLPEDETKQEQKQKGDTNKKKKKKKGPIRFEAVLPVIIIIGLTWAYYVMFFDSHLKAALEWGATQGNGAEVNIENLKTSIAKGSFEIKGIQVTNKEKPEFNLIQIGRINLQVLWDGLLRAKFVVNDASIENIQANAPRKKPGKVLPPPEPDEESEGIKMVNKAKQEVLDHAQKEFNQNILGDVAGVLKGTDPKDALKNIKGQLQADAKIKELNEELDKKQNEWQQRIDSLPKPKEFEDLADRAKGFKLDKNPATAIKQVKELSGLVKEAKQKYKAYEDTSSSLKGDINRYKDLPNEIETLIKKDVSDLQKRLNIPELNVADFSKGLFGTLFAKYAGEFKGHMQTARKYMPPAKSKEEKQAAKLTPRERQKGRNYKFHTKKSYPVFWLQKGKISSVSNQDQYSGDIEGTISDITTNPQLLGKPAVLEITKGEFPHQRISGLRAKLTIDHTTNVAVEKIEASVASYPVDKKVLSKSDDVGLAITQAQGVINIFGELKDQIMTLNINNDFVNVGYDVQAKNKYVKQIISNVVNGIPKINVTANARGNWENLDWKIRSNLATELSRGVKKEVDAKVQEAKAKVQKFVDEKIGGNKQKLMSKYNNLKDKIDNLLSKQKKEIQSAKDKVSSNVKNKEDEAKSKSKAKLKDKAKSLLKGLKF